MSRRRRILLRRLDVDDDTPTAAELARDEAPGPYTRPLNDEDRKRIADDYGWDIGAKKEDPPHDQERTEGQDR